MMRILLVADPVSSEALKTALGYSLGACSKCAAAASFEISTMADAAVSEEVPKEKVDFALIEFDPNRAPMMLRVDEIFDRKQIPHAFYTRTMDVVVEGVPLKSPLWPGNGFRLDLVSKILDHFLGGRTSPGRRDCATAKSGI